MSAGVDLGEASLPYFLIYYELANRVATDLRPARR